MGSGASRSSVNDVTHITTNNSDSTEIPELVTHRPPSGISRRWSLRRRNSVKETDNDVICALQKRITDYEAEVKTLKDDKKTMFSNMHALEKQLAETESGNLDLEEQVQVLREHIDQHQNLAEDPETPEFVNTLTIKDNQIEKLESELSDSHTSIAKLRSRFKKKIKSMRNLMSEMQHEASLEQLEVKTELQLLKTENKELLERIRQKEISTDGKPLNSILPSPADVGKTQVIVELSAKVNEQEARIMELEKELIEAECGTGYNQRMVPQSPRSVRRSNSTPATPPAQRKLIKVKDTAKSINCERQLYSPRGEEPSLLSPRSRDETDDIGCTRALASEIEQMRTERCRVKTRVKNQFVRDEQRESSGVSRDSGVMSTDFESSPQHSSATKSRQTNSQRPTSSTSTLSNLSDIDSFTFSEENLYECKTYVIKDTPVETADKIKSQNIRQVSAPRKKKKRDTVSDYEHVRELLRTPAESH